MTAPSGAIFPRRTAIPASFCRGASILLITSESKISPSPIVDVMDFPVTVMACGLRSFSSCLKTALNPPAR